MADIVARHGQKRIKGVLIGIDRDRLFGHDGGHWLIITAALGNDTIAQVTVGHDPGNAITAFGDQQTGNAFLAHQLASFKD